MGLAHINCKLLESSYVLLESRAHTGNIAQMMFPFSRLTTLQQHPLQKSFIILEFITLL